MLGQFAGAAVLAAGQLPYHVVDITDDYPVYVEGLHAQTGKWPAYIAAAYGWMGPVDRTMDLVATNRILKDYWKAGGLVSLLWAPRNPWTHGNQSDRSNLGSLTDLVTDGTAAHTYWMAQLDQVATGLADLQAAGVTVMWRPLHEMNGAWMWWSPDVGGATPTPAEFTALWRHMYNYFTQTKHLNNLIWVYSPTREQDRYKPELYYYPGDAYVDVAGIDLYTDQLSFPNYATMSAVGKPVGFCEFGPDTRTSALTKNAFDFASLMPTIKASCPGMCFLMTWNSNPALTPPVYWAPVDQRNAASLYNDPWALTRDDLAWKR